MTWLYRHDEILTNRPYAFDVDAEDWLWEGCGYGRVVGHNLRTAEVRVIPVPEMTGRVVYECFAWHGKLVMVLGSNCQFYLVLDPATGDCVRRDIPAANAIVWYGVKTTNDKLLLFERSESKVLILDAPDATPRAVDCPFPGQLAGGVQLENGLVYSSLREPARIVRFDPVAERFIDENLVPVPDANMSGKVELGGVLYCADSAGGRLLPLEVGTGKWLEPIAVEGHGRDFGFIGGAFGFGGKAFYCLSTYRFSSRLDPKTGRIITPEGADVGVDGFPPRFMERYLVFDPAERRCEYLEAPPQPDGIPLLCYAWTDGLRFAITGIVIPFAKPGEPGRQHGPWIVLQNEPAEDEPGFGPHQLDWDRQAHIGGYHRSYGYDRSLYLPEPRHSPATTNMSGPAVQYSPGKSAELERRAAKTDATEYWRDLADRLLAGVEGDAEKAKRLTAFVDRSLYYNPIQEPLRSNPIGILESHDARCGQGVSVTLALMAAAGIECRRVSLHHHVVAEARYDGQWHIADALFFGAEQPSREGRVLSVAELQADPYFADAYPQHCFVYDPALLTSEDDFQVLGYVFGPWGSQTYYSYYLGAEIDYPPTLPTCLPAQRAGVGELRLRWTEAARIGGGPIEYELRVFADRACTEEVFRTVTPGCAALFAVPEANRMYFIEVRAIDAHRSKNPATWYPAARWNLVFVPPDQYGWYGVV